MDFFEQAALGKRLGQENQAGVDETRMREARLA
jgi:hypothetical protein